MLAWSCFNHGFNHGNWELRDRVHGTYLDYISPNTDRLTN